MTLEQIRKLLAEISPGPWEWTERYRGDAGALEGRGSPVLTPEEYYCTIDENDKTFIVCVFEIVAFLLGEVERLQNTIDGLVGRTHETKEAQINKTESGPSQDAVTPATGAATRKD